jgi:hypothetical protein
VGFALKEERGQLMSKAIIGSEEKDK